MPREVTTGLYTFDPTKSNPANIVTNEKHAVYVPERDDFHFIIPLAAPFFVNDLVVRNDTTNEVYVEGNDYVIGHWFVEAMNSTGRPIAGSIRFLKRDVAGIISLNYHTLGGEWGYDNAAVLKELSQRAVNPLTRAWAQIDTLPTLFPPTPHDQQVDTLVGFDDIVDKMADIVNAIESSGDGAGITHITDTSNPHGTNKVQVGLGSVENYPMATPLEAVSVRSDRYMSPSTTREAIVQIGIAPLNDHKADTSNPHNVTKAQVGLNNLGNYPLANEAEARNVSITTRYMNPWAVGMALDEFYNVRLAPLFGTDPNNPTGVTKEIIGLGDVENYGIASQTNMITGTSNSHYTTPLRVWEAIDYHALVPLGQHLADTNNPHDTTPAKIGTLTTAQITTLINSRLGINGTAYDSDRLFGMGKAALYADVLAGQSTNASQLEGRTFIQVKDEVLTGKAADSALFDGKTFAQVQSDLLSGSANNAGQLEGRTFIQVRDEILAGKAADSTLFDGRTFIQASSEILAGKAADSTLFDGRGYNQVLADFLTGTIYNSNRLDGKTYTEIQNAFLASTVDNATLFDGRTFIQVRDEVLAGKAADSTLFDGRTYIQVKDEVLAGKAADSALFDGRTAASWSQEITNVLQGKAADSTLFDGRTYIQVRDDVLTGKVADSALFDGRTAASWSQEITDVLQGQVADSERLEGRTFIQVKDEVLADKAADSALFDGRTAASWSQEITNVLQGKAADSTLFDGRTFVQVRDEILTGKAADSTLFDGRSALSWSQEITDVLQGKAADSTLFDGRTTLQWEQEITTAAEQAASVHDGSIKNTPFLLTDASYTDYTKILTRDGFGSSWLLTHITSTGGTAFYQVSIPTTGNDVKIQALNDEPQELTFLADTSVGLTLWVRVDDGDLSINFIPITGSGTEVVFEDTFNLSTALSPLGTDITIIGNNAKLIADLADAFNTATAELS